MHKIFLFLIYLGLALPALATEREVILAGRKVYEWPPAQQIYEKAPIVVFSHGFRGCGTQSRFLMEVFANKGFWVFAPNHADANCGLNREERLKLPEEEARFRKPSTWSADTYAGRKEDIIAVLDALRSDPERGFELDFDAIGLAGHSLGGYTVLALAGAWPEWKDWNKAGVKAVLAFSPYTRPFNLKNSWKNLAVPVMFQGGMLDTGMTPSITMPESGAYALAPAPKYLVVFKNAGHLAWTDVRDKSHDGISRYSLAFFLHYLTGETTPMLTRSGDDVSKFDYESELGKSESDNSKNSDRRFGNTNGGAKTIRSGSWRDRNGTLKTFGDGGRNEGN